MAERNLVRLPRNPDMLLAFTVQPIMFVLLFAYVFGGAIETPGLRRLHRLPDPGDHRPADRVRRVRDRARARGGHDQGPDRPLPLAADARASVLAGRTLADVATNLLSIVILLVTGLVIGFRFDATRAGDRRRPRACCCCSASRSRGSSR